MVEKLFGSWAKESLRRSLILILQMCNNHKINFVDMPMQFSLKSQSNTINLKLTDKQYFAAILANQILGGGGGRLFLNLREKHTDGHTALILI
jgi:predicted Zn-dependent peptidase